MRVAPAKHYWSTGDEKRFISRLGSFGVSTAERCKLLEGYIAGAEKREDWGSVDKEEVLEYARQCLWGREEEE